MFAQILKKIREASFGQNLRSFLVGYEVRIQDVQYQLTMYRIVFVVVRQEYLNKIFSLPGMKMSADET